MAHSGVGSTSSRGANKKQEVLSIPFMKKYIQYAKTRIKPVLTQEASDRIADIYVSLRNDEMEGNQRKTSPMTVRTLETLIRLATAHAKSRLSNRVEERDATAAEAILRFALFKEVVEDESRKKRRKTRPIDSDSDSDETSDSDDGYRGSAPRVSTSRSVRTRQRTANGQPSGANGGNGPAIGRSRRVLDAENDGSDDDEEDDAPSSGPRKSGGSGRNNGATSGEPSQSQLSFASSMPASQLESQSQQGDTQEDAELADGAAALNIGDAPISPQRVGIFRTALGQLLNTPLFEDDAANVDEVISAINGKVGSGRSFNKEEAIRALRELNQANDIM
jgi:DNA replication licensing factor MCM3